MKLDTDLLKDLGIVDYAYTEEAKAKSFLNFKNWLEKNWQGPLTYLTGDRGEKRADLKLFWPEFQSAIVFLFSYKIIKKKLLNDTNLKQNIASYTMGFEGFDYHKTIPEKLNSIIVELRKNYPELNYKIALDIHPVLDRDLAYRAGLGWFGKNSMLIHQKEGSYFIIASLLLDQKLNFPFKKIETDHCGQCTKCIDACPTEAIDPISRTIKAHDCISTFTIEQFKVDSVPSLKMDLSTNNIFGCDICQDVCPWNKKVIGKISEVEIPAQYSIMQNQILEWFTKLSPELIINKLQDISDRSFRKIFQHTSFERGGKNSILKNFIFLSKKKY